MPVLSLPLMDFVPAHAPEAVQPVAFAELQFKVDEPPIAIDDGLADSEIVGAFEGSGVGDGVGVGLGDGDGPVPGVADEVVEVTLPSHPARNIPITAISEANTTVRKLDETI